MRRSTRRSWPLAILLAISAFATASAPADDGAVLGNPTVGADRRYASPDYKLATRAELDAELTIVRVSAFLSGTGTSGSQAVRAVVYSDSGGQPASLVAASQETSVPYSAPGGWTDFALPRSVTLQPGTYWLGLHSGPRTGDALIHYAFAASPAAQRTKSDLYSDGPATLFGAGSVQDRSMSIYASGLSGSAPTNSVAPSIVGTAREGEVLRAQPGEWSGSEPIDLTYRWLRCAPACVEQTDGQEYTLTDADVGATFAVDVTATNAHGASTARSPATPVVAAASSDAGDGLTVVAGPLSGSSDPTYYTSNRRMALTRGGRLLVVHGKHGTGVQLAWRDRTSSWRTQTTGAVLDGLILSGTGTGDWLTSIASAPDSTGGETAWVVWSRAGFGVERPVQLRRLSNLDAPDGPTVGPIVTVETPPLGAARADLAVERGADGSARVCIAWTRRVSDTLSEVVTAWVTNLDTDTPSIEATTVVLPPGTTAKTATLAPTNAGMRLVTPGSRGRVQLFGHDLDRPLTEWWTGPQGVKTVSASRPAAVATASGDVVVAVEANTVSSTSVVQRFTRTSVTDELTLAGYAMPSVASDGTQLWLASIRRSDGFVVSRAWAPATGWTGADRIEVGSEGGGGYSWPNLMREVDGRVRLLVSGPSSSSSRSSVLAYQRPT